MFVAYEIINCFRHFICAHLTLSIEMKRLLVDSDFNAYRIHSVMCAVQRWWFSHQVVCVPPW